MSDYSHIYYDLGDEDGPGYLWDQANGLKKGDTVVAYVDAAGRLNVFTFPKAVLSAYMDEQIAIYDALGPAADDVLEMIAEEYPKAQGLNDVLTVYR